MQKLTALQLRVIGCLVEKMITTPEQYPLSLNSLTLACNQKSNREPVLQLAETQVLDTLHELKTLRLVVDDAQFAKRTLKYQQRFCNTEFGTLQLSDQELALLCVMFLRGPQTPGELRVRTQRLCEFLDVDEVEATLVQLSQRRPDAMVVKLPREPGKNASRYMHLFGIDDIELSQAQLSYVDEGSSDHKQLSQSDGQLETRVNDLEAVVENLQQQVVELKNLLEELMQ